MFASWRRPFLPAAVLGLVFACGLSAGGARAMERGDLEEMERLLRDLGFDPGKVDGVVDDATTDAIRRYQQFAVLPDDPEPSERLLDELRGVAAAFAALNAEKTASSPEPALSPSPAPSDAPAAPPEALPDLGAGPAEKAKPAPPPQDEPAQQAEAPPAKEIVPPPPPPPKLKPPEAAEENRPQVAELPPAAAPQAEAAAPPESGPEPVDEAQARIDAELTPYRARLKDGSLTREALARQFNDEGRKLMQQSNFDEAIVKFSVAIQLDPGFAGAYSNRGTAYQRQDQSDLAKADFDHAKKLGFGGFRLRSAENPLK